MVTFSFYDDSNLFAKEKITCAKGQLICICKQKPFSPGFLFIYSSQTDNWKLYQLKLSNRILSSSSCFSETASLIICEISLFITAAKREAILLVTYASLALLAQRNWRWISEQPCISGGWSWVTNQSSRKTLSTVLEYTLYNSPQSIDQNSNMTPWLFGQNWTFSTIPLPRNF